MPRPSCLLTSPFVGVRGAAIAPHAVLANTEYAHSRVCCEFAISALCVPKDGVPLVLPELAGAEDDAVEALGKQGVLLSTRVLPCSPPG